MSRPVRLMIIAGEVSGDMHAGGFLAAIRARRPDAEFFGIGGDAMRRAGTGTLYDIRDMAVMGLTEVLARYFFFRKVFHRMLEVARDRKPDAVILVDYPGFNLRLAKRLHNTGPRIIYYICPQIWAWNRGRIPEMARVVDRLITIFPFEPALFEGAGLRAEFAGHPLVDEARRTFEEPLADLPWKGEPRVALLPGSRPHEVRRILPAVWKAAELIEERMPSAGFIIAAPSEAMAETIRGKVQRLGGGPGRWEIVAGQTRQILRQAAGSLIASGTATLEAALMRCPAVVVYRTSLFTYLLARMLVRVPHIGIVNVIAGRQVCPEFIQGAASPQNLAGALFPLLQEGPERASMLAGYREVVQSLGPGGASERAADIVLEELA